MVRQDGPAIGIGSAGGPAAGSVAVSQGIHESAVFEGIDQTLAESLAPFGFQTGCLQAVAVGFRHATQCPHAVAMGFMDDADAVPVREGPAVSGSAPAAGSRQQSQQKSGQKKGFSQLHITCGRSYTSTAVSNSCRKRRSFSK